MTPFVTAESRPRALLALLCQAGRHEDPDAPAADAHRCPGPPEACCTCTCHVRSELWHLAAGGVIHHVRRTLTGGRAVAWCNPDLRGRSLIAAELSVTCPQCDAKQYGYEQVMQ